MAEIAVRKGGGVYFDDLKKRMDAAGISAGQLARQSGIDKTQLSRWFSHRVKNPRLESVLALENAFTAIVAHAAKAARRKR